MKQLLVFSMILLTTFCLGQEESYEYGPNSKIQEGVPQGVVTDHVFESKTIYPGTFRKYSLYVPAQYKSDEPAALMVFQDGHSFLNPTGNVRATIVYDNLINQGKLPTTICLFINPGHTSEDFPDNLFRCNNRGVEYDEMNSKYIEFLTQELLPEIEKNYTLTDDPKQRGIGGLSSGGICAFTAAWQRPDYFYRVLSHSGSFTNIRGGNQYPSLIRTEDKKDIKILIQCGSGDLDNQYGDWWIANQDMASSFNFKKYDFKFVKGTGAHNGKHGGAILPESLLWLWAD